MLEAMRIQERCSFDSRHRVSVHELSIAERILAKRALDLESEFAIESDGRLVVSENGQLDSRQIQPSVSQINHRLHHCRSNTFALPIVANHHPDLCSVIDSRSQRRMQANYADDLAVDAGDQVVVDPLRFC